MRLIYYIIVLLGVAAMPEVSKQRLAVREVAQKASLGDAKALYDLAMLHDMGYDSIPVDSMRATLLYRLSAERGYAPAQSYLGYRYFNGEAVRQDVDSALFWMAKGAANGDAKAANNLGYILANSELVTRDYPQALYWLTKAADAGLPAGLSQLADLYRRGLGCEADTARAESLYVEAIHKGLQDAELKLLAMKGRKWETLSADSALSLGKYHYSHGAPVIAVTLFENIIAGKGATAADTKEMAKALALLGDAYSRGMGVEYDYARSTNLFYEAALRGDPSAQFVIAELLDIFPDALDSISTDPELINASYWYEKAAAEGITDAATATVRLLE